MKSSHFAIFWLIALILARFSHVWHQTRCPNSSHLSCILYVCAFKDNTVELPEELGSWVDEIQEIPVRKTP